MVTGEATIIVPQIIQQSLISLTVVDLPDPVINKAKVNKEIIEIKEGDFIGFFIFKKYWLFRLIFYN